MSDASYMGVKAEHEAVALLAEIDVHPAVDHLPYCSAEGGYQYTQGPEVDLDDLREELPDMTDEAWALFLQHADGMAPYFRMKHYDDEEATERLIAEAEAGDGPCEGEVDDGDQGG